MKFKRVILILLAIITLVSIPLSVLAADDPEKPGLIENLLAKFISSIARKIDDVVIGGISGDMTYNEETSKKRPYVDNIVFNRFLDTKLSFFDAPAADVDGSKVAARLHDIVAKWYVAMRYVAMIGYLIAIFYIGIRILMTTVGKQRATYKELLQYWVTGLLILFTFHWVMAYLIWGNNVMVDMFRTAAEGTAGAGKPLSDAFRTAAQGDTATFVNAGLYITFVVMCIAFIIVYYKRVVVIAFLIMVFPLVTISFVIDKVGDGKSQAWDNWFKEFSVNVLVQMFHAFLLCILSSIALDSAIPALLRIIALAFLFPAEGIIRGIFGVKSSTSSHLAEGAAVGLGTLAAGKAAIGRLKNNAGLLTSAGKELGQGIIQDRKAKDPNSGVKKRTSEEKIAWRRSVASKATRGFTETAGAGLGAFMGTFAGVGATGSLKGAINGGLAGAAIGDLAGDYTGRLAAATGTVVGAGAYLGYAKNKGKLAQKAGVDDKSASEEYKKAKMKSYALTSLATAAFGKGAGDFAKTLSSPDYGDFYVPQDGDKVQTDTYKDKSYTYVDKIEDGKTVRKMVSIGKGNSALGDKVRSDSYISHEAGSIHPTKVPDNVYKGFKTDAATIANKDFGERASLSVEDQKRWDNSYNQAMSSMSKQYVATAAIARGTNTHWEFTGSSIGNGSNLGIEALHAGSFSPKTTYNEAMNNTVLPETFRAAVNSYVNTEQIRSNAVQQIQNNTELQKQITREAREMLDSNPELPQIKAQGFAAEKQALQDAKVQCQQKYVDQEVVKGENTAFRKFVNENPHYTAMVAGADQMNDASKFTYEDVTLPQNIADKPKTPLSFMDNGQGTTYVYDMTGCDTSGPTLVNTVTGGEVTGVATARAGYVGENGKVAMSISHVEIPSSSFSGPEDLDLNDPGLNGWGSGPNSGGPSLGAVIDLPYGLQTNQYIADGDVVNKVTTGGVDHFIGPDNKVLFTQPATATEGTKSVMQVIMKDGKPVAKIVKDSGKMDGTDKAAVMGAYIDGTFKGKADTATSSKYELATKSLEGVVVGSVGNLYNR